MTDGASSRERIESPKFSPDPVECLHRQGFRLGDWRVEPRGNRIVSAQAARQVDPRAMEVLVHLAARSGQVVTRDELCSAVWPDTFVNDNTVSQAVSRLRRVLGDDPQQPRFIETIAKSGYRLLPEIESDLKNEDRSPDITQSPLPRRSDDVHAPRPRVSDRLLYLGVGLVALTLAGVWIWTGRSGSVPQPDPAPVASIVPELTLVGPQFEPVLSPAGDRVAFAWRPDSQAPWSIWIKEVGGDSQVRLTNNEHSERLPSWSPDGKAVAYISGETVPTNIMQTSLLSGVTERLDDCPAGIRSLNWSPDGKTLALAVGGQERRTLRLELLDLETRKKRVLTEPPQGIIGDLGPVFSPDGSQIAFERRHGTSRHDVMVMDAAGGEPRALTEDRWGQLRGVAWTSDGSSVVFASNRSGHYSLWQVLANGGPPTRLPIHDTWVTQPSVARDGERLIYRTFRDVVDIWALPLDPEGNVAADPVKRVSSTRSERHPAWSPDGKAIAFLSDRSGSIEVWSGAPDGSALMRHTDFAGAIPNSPTWAPDGSQLLFDAAVDGHSDLWTVGSDSRRPIRLTTETPEECNGSFSRDGQWIYFASDRSGTWEVWRIPSAGGAAVAMTQSGGFLAQESVDGSQLYFVKFEEPGIWRMPVEGGEAEVVLPDVSLSDWGSWVVGHNGIYFVKRGPTTIQFLDFAAGTVRTIFTPQKQLPYLGRSLSLSPDGRSLLFAMIDHSDDEVMRVDMVGL